MTTLLPLAGAGRRAAAQLVPRRAGLRRGGRGRHLPVAALRRAGDAVRAAARHGDELPVGRRARARRASSSPRARCCASGVALLGLRITLGAGRALGWQPVAGWSCCRVVLTIGVSMLAARAAGLPGPVRPAHRRRHRDLRRLGRAGAGRRAAGPPAEGARHAVHGDRRVGAVDAGDDRLPDDRARARARPARRPACSSAPPSTTWRRWSAPATACRSETGDVGHRWSS